MRVSATEPQTTSSFLLQFWEVGGENKNTSGIFLQLTAGSGICMTLQRRAAFQLRVSKAPVQTTWAEWAEVQAQVGSSSSSSAADG